MNKQLNRLGALALAGVLGFGSANALGKDKEKKDKGEDKRGQGSANVEKAFQKRDANGDGKLTLDEFKKGLPEQRAANADKRFKQIDGDGDGSVTLAEFKAAMEKSQDRRKKDS